MHLHDAAPTRRSPFARHAPQFADTRVKSLPRRRSRRMGRDTHARRLTRSSFTRPRVRGRNRARAEHVRRRGPTHFQTLDLERGLDLLRHRKARKARSSRSPSRRGSQTHHGLSGVRHSRPRMRSASVGSFRHRARSDGRRRDPRRRRCVLPRAAAATSLGSQRAARCSLRQRTAVCARALRTSRNRARRCRTRDADAFAVRAYSGAM